jgi:hypothetical protein
MNDFQIAVAYYKLNSDKLANIISWFIFNPKELRHQYNEEKQFKEQMGYCWK